MSDYISRQAAIDALREVIVPAKDIGFGDELTDGYNDGLDMAITVVSELPSAQPEPSTDKEQRMKIGDEVFVHGYVDEIRKDAVIIRNDGGYFGTVECEISAQPEQQWIPCSERLPKLDNSYANSKEYLTQWDDGSIDITRYSNVNIFWQNEITEPYWKGEQCSKVIAWMPLPEPYKGEES